MVLALNYVRKKVINFCLWSSANQNHIFQSIRCRHYKVRNVLTNFLNVRKKIVIQILFVDHCESKPLSPSESEFLEASSSLIGDVS